MATTIIWSLISISINYPATLLNMYEDRWVFNGTVNLDNCITTSGNPVVTAMPHLSFTNDQFQVSSGNSVNFYVIDAITYKKKAFITALTVPNKKNPVSSINRV